MKRANRADFSFRRPPPRSRSARLRGTARHRRRLNPSAPPRTAGAGAAVARAAVEAVDAATPRRISRRAAVAGRACRGLAGAVLVRSLFVTFVNATCRSSPMQQCISSVISVTRISAGSHQPQAFSTSGEKLCSVRSTRSRVSSAPKFAHQRSTPRRTAPPSFRPRESREKKNTDLWPLPLATL